MSHAIFCDYIGWRMHIGLEADDGAMVWLDTLESAVSLVLVTRHAF